MTNRQWVTLLYSFARQSHQSCLHHACDQQAVSDIFFARQSDQSSLIPPTGSKWCCFISLPSGYVLSHANQQKVRGTALFLCQALINHISSHDQQRVSGTLVFLQWSHQSCLTPWKQGVSDTTLIVYQASHESCTNRGWVALLYIFLCKALTVPWATGSEWWHCFISLPCSLINCVSSHN